MAAQHSNLGARAVDRMLAVAAGVLILSGALPVVAGATDEPVVLNEALIWHSSADTMEFLELYGTPGRSVAGLSLIAVEGDGTTAGTIDFRLDLPADARLGGNGFYLAGGPALSGAPYAVTPDLPFPGPKTSEWLENGSQTLALAETASIGAVGSQVTGGEVILDAVGLTDGGASDAWFFGAPVVGPDDTFAPPGVRRLLDGVDTDTAGDFAFADDLLGPANTPTRSTRYDVPPDADCGPALSTVEGTAASTTVTATDPDGKITSFTVTPSPSEPGIALGTWTAAASQGDTATAEVLVSADAVAGSYSVTVEATNDGETPQSASCVLAVNIDPAPLPVPPPAPLDTLTAMLGVHLDAGHVDAGKARVLSDRLERVERFLDAGQTSAAAAQLQAFANQVLGLSPRWVDPGAADELAAAAGALRSALLG